MAIAGVKFASLDEDRLQTLKALEDEVGVYLLAVEPSTLKLAHLSPDQIKKIQAAESDLGVMLVAFQKDGD